MSLKVLVFVAGTFCYVDCFEQLQELRSIMEVVFDFSMLSATVENNEIANYISSITPNNFLSFLDFLKDSGYVISEDFVNEVDYSVAEY